MIMMQFTHYNQHTLVKLVSYHWSLFRHASASTTRSPQLSKFLSQKYVISSSYRLYTESVAHNNAAPAFSTHKAITEVVQGLNSIEAVLQGSSGLQLDPDSALVFLSKLSLLCSDDSKSSKSSDVQHLLSDVRFKKLGEILHENVLSLNPKTLISSICCLLPLTTDDSFILKSLQQQLVWMLKRIPLHQLLPVVALYQKHQETPMRQNVYKEILQVMEKRWVEIAHPADIVTLMYMANDYPGKMDFFSKLEDRALDLCDRMTTKDLYRVFYLLGKHNKRNTPLLRALVYHLLKNIRILTNVQFANLCYSAASLSYLDDNLFKEISSVILARLGKIENHLVASIVHSFSVSKWLQPMFMDAAAERLVTSGDVTPAQLMSLLLSCAKLNHLPPAVGGNINNVMRVVSRELDSQHRMWLDVIWSLAVLNVMDTNMAAGVLTEEFVNVLSTSEGGRLHPPSQLKLANIAGAAELLLKGYTGPLPTMKTLENYSCKMSLKQHHPAEDVISTLCRMVPVDKYLRQFVNTPYGYIIDVEMVVDPTGAPQVITDIQAPWSPCASVLPEGWMRLALKVFDFNDYTHGKVHLTGVHSLGCRILSAAGYTVVQVPFASYNQESSIVGKLNYIRSLMSASLDNQTSSYNKAGQTAVTNMTKIIPPSSKKKTTTPKKPLTIELQQKDKKIEENKLLGNIKDIFN